MSSAKPDSVDPNLRFSCSARYVPKASAASSGTVNKKTSQTSGRRDERCYKEAGRVRAIIFQDAVDMASVLPNDRRAFSDGGGERLSGRKGDAHYDHCHGEPLPR